MKISVIIPTKNEQKNIRRCLESLKIQGLQSFEIIVVDNFSTDKTIEIAKKFTKKVFQKGLERSTQRNFGLKKASGKYILFVDADMQLTPNLLNECYHLMKNNPEVTGVFIDEISKGTTFLARAKALEKELTRGQRSIEAARFFRKKDLIKIGGYDEKLVSGEDWDLSWRITKFGNFGHVRAKIYHFENHSILEELKKKYYYAKNIQRYTNKHPRLFKKQAGFGRFSMLFKKPKMILANPVGFASLLVLKSTQYFVYLLAKI